MALLAINHHPSKKELLVFGVGLPILVGLLGWHRFIAGNILTAQIIWGVGGAVSLVFALVPPARRFVYLGWMYAVFPVAFVVSHFVLGVVYFAVLTPMALLLKAMGKDPMNRKFDKGASSYWVMRDTGSDKARYFRQF